MSGISRSRRWLSTAVCSALVASGVTVSTATAQSSVPASSSGLLAGSSVEGSSVGSENCSASGNESCTVDNEVVRAEVAPLVGHESVTTTLTITALQDNAENVAVAYSAEGLENVVATSNDDRVTITSDGDVFSATVEGNLTEDETVTVDITADLVEDHEGERTQALTVTSETQLTGALNALPGYVFLALGAYALLEHAHNMHWIPREVDQLLYRLTGRDPELSRIQWTIF